jgi:hypothetical protein
MVNPMKTTTRVFERQKWRTKRVAGIPVSLLALVMISITAVAAIVALGPFSAPATSTPQAIYVGQHIGPTEPAYGGVEAVLPYGSTDHVWLDTWQAGYSVSTPIHLVIRVGSTSFTTCADAAAAIMSGAGDVGKISLDLHPFTTPVLVSIDAASSTFASGKCTIDAGIQFPAKLFTVTSAMTSAAKGVGFDIAFGYATTPNAVTWEFQAEQ